MSLTVALSPEGKIPNPVAGRGDKGSTGQGLALQFVRVKSFGKYFLRKSAFSNKESSFITIST